jgi:hypothetical protein
LRQEQGPEHHPPSAAELGRTWMVVTGETTACELAGGRRVSRSAGRLRLSPKPSAVPEPPSVEV